MRVIERALKDLKLRTKKQGATEWIAGRTPASDALSIQACCRVAEVSPNRVRGEAIRRTTGKEPEQVNLSTRRRFGLDP